MYVQPVHYVTEFYFKQSDGMCFGMLISQIALHHAAKNTR